MVQRGDPTQGDPERSLEDRRCGSWRHESPTHTAPARGASAFEQAFARRMLRLRKTVELNATSCSKCPRWSFMPNRALQHLKLEVEVGFESVTLCVSFAGDRPVLAIETLHPNELLGVSGHQDQTPRQRLTRDQGVKRPDGASDCFEVRPNRTCRTGVRGIEGHDFERDAIEQSKIPIRVSTFEGTVVKLVGHRSRQPEF